MNAVATCKRRFFISEGILKATILFSKCNDYLRDLVIFTPEEKARAMEIGNPGVFARRLLGFVLAAAVLVSCNRTICVMTYNVGAFSKYQENSTPGVAAAVKGVGAEVVALNELDSCNRRHEVYQLEEFAREMGGWQYHFASAFPFAGGGYGNGVATGDNILRRFRIDLPKGDGSEPRSVAVVETDDYVFASTHLDYLAETAAIAQADVINNWFTEHYFGSRKPVFLCGDMNAEPGSKVIGALSRCWEILSSDSPTYPCAPSTMMAGGLGTFANEEARPKMCIDYIMRFRYAGDASVENTGCLLSLPERCTELRCCPTIIPCSQGFE